MGDLTTATKFERDPDVPPRIPAGLAHQAVEKGLKASLIACGIQAPRTHDIEHLRDTLPEGWQVKVQFPDLVALQQWYAENRYPANLPDADAVDATFAVTFAWDVVECLRADLRERGYDV